MTKFPKSFSISRETLELLKKLAKDESRTMSGMIEALIKRAAQKG